VGGLRPLWRGAGRLLLLIVALTFGGCSDRSEDWGSLAAFEPHAPPAYFTAAPEAPLSTPRVEQLSPRLPRSANAIWGGTGRDSDGHIWFGVCVRNVPGRSARLLEFDPEADKFTERGDVLSELRRLGMLREGECQGKIHTRIVQAGDGHLYFASMDEQGADYDSGTRPPTWGSHLWRLRMPERTWEHLMSAPEGLIAVSGTGRRIYALGFFGHRLYQYDTETGRVLTTEVGSVDGHISRNFVTDYRDHAYVPRLRRATFSGEAIVTLAEYDTALRKLRETPLEDYFSREPNDSHGLTAFQPMADDSIVIVTALGYMYRIAPPPGEAPAEVFDVGWLHPDGERYVAGLFTYAGRRYVMGLATGDKDTGKDKVYEWVFRDLINGEAVPVPFVVQTEKAPPLRNCLLYGSVTRDNAGRFYVVGSHWSARKPLILRVSCP